MSGAVIIQQGNGQEIDLSAMIQSAVTSAIVDVEQQKKTQSKRGRSDRGTGSEKLGNILRGYREFMEFSQSELSRMSGVHPTTISKIEDGERGISLVTLAKLAPNLPDGFSFQVLDYYRRDGDAEGTATVHQGPRGEAGGPEPEHPIPELGGLATEAAGGDEADRGTG
jgi:transcriptional regulator with XRE-family HTH domain